MYNATALPARTAGFAFYAAAHFKQNLYYHGMKWGRSPEEVAGAVRETTAGTELQGLSFSRYESAQDEGRPQEGR